MGPDQFQRISPSTAGFPLLILSMPPLLEKLVKHRHRQRTVASARHTASRWDLGWHWVFLTVRSEEHTSELQSRRDVVCRLLLEKKKKKKTKHINYKKKQQKTYKIT